MTTRAAGAARALAAITGLGLLALAATPTLGVALAAPAGMITVIGVHRLRGRRWTRVGSWLGAVVATALVAVIFLGWAMRRVPASTFERARQQAAIDRQRRRSHPSRAQRVIQRIAPPSPAAPVIQARTDSLVNTPGFFWGVTIVAGIIGCGFFGTIVGSFGWACAMLVAFGALGRWPGGPAPPVRDAPSLPVTG
ncbi:MAG TPA: hypothetical protein VF041_21390 [Gemmatimonadaceae bacterium]